MGFGPRGWGFSMLAGAAMTVAVAACGFLLGAVVGVFGAWAKIGGGRITRAIADGYTTVLRGIPDLLVIYLFYFGAGALLTPIARFFGSTGFISLRDSPPARWRSASCPAPTTRKSFAARSMLSAAARSRLRQRPA